MSDNNRAQELLAQEGLESIAQKLYNKIYLELPGEPNAPRRWIWELLQNAKDVISNDGKVIINLSENSLDFSHNGSPFLHKNLLALLSQNSTKKHNYSDDEKLYFFSKLYNEDPIPKEVANNFLSTTGRFGTGFMTTYLLSKKVHLEGVYSTNGHHKKFKLSFDRDVERDSELKQKVKDSFSSFTELEKSNDDINKIKDYKSGKSCDTKFIYEFDDSGKEIAVQGISDLHSAIPFVLSFVDKISTIQISEFGRTTTYTHSTEINEGIFSIEKIERKSNDKEDVFYVAKLTEKYNSLSIATPLEKMSSGRFKVIFPNKETPRQFISFPLVGSETFPFPVIINSPLFNPNDSRSHAYLNLTNSIGFDKKVKLNRLLFEKAVELYKKLLDRASKEDWENINILAKSDLPTNLDDDWYKDSIQRELRKEILEAKIVVTDDGGKIKPKDALFPIHEKSQLEPFWELCKYLNKTKLPRKTDVETWKTIVAASSDNWLGKDFNLTLEKLLKQIESEKTFKQFNIKYFDGDEATAFKSLNEIIQFAEKEDNYLINDKENAISIFPNQTLDSQFSTKKSLSRDLGIPKQIKDVLNILGEDWYKELVRNEITVFERDAKLTVKDSSNKIREIIELWMADKLIEDKKIQIGKGLFKLTEYCTEETKDGIIKINKYLKEYFPDKLNENVEVLNAIVEFNWNPIKKWGVLQLFQKISSFECLNNFSQFLYKEKYPPVKEKYTEEENEMMFNVDKKVNELIQFGLSFDKTLLEKFPVIPNQLNKLCILNKEIYNDDNIPVELKKIIADFGYECRGSLLHTGVSVDLPNDKRNLKWICGELDDIVIKEQENPEVKQPIRDLEKWISKKKGTISRLDELFKTFYRKRSGIVLNTYDIEERDQFDAILKSGMSNDFAEIVKSGTSIESIKKITTILKENPDINPENIGDIVKAASVLKKHPELTSEKIEQLLELEELSKGWNPELTYTPDEEQIRRNFENGWKGEAFVFKELKKLGLVVEWMNLSQGANKNKIIDYVNEVHYIIDKGDKYDLIVRNQTGKVTYIQVKTTTTSITEADQIALPISTREWNFVFETIDDDYYLARVFDINKAPSVYYMKLELPKELLK